MTRYVVLALASIGGLVLGAALGISIATLTEPADSVVATQLTPGNAAGVESAPSSPSQSATDAGRTADASSGVLSATSGNDAGSSPNGAVEEPDYVELARRRDGNVALISQAIVAVESYGCGVGVRATGLGIDASTVLIPSAVQNASWYVSVGDDGYPLPQHLLVGGVPAIRANVTDAMSAAVPFGELGPDEEATIVWAEGSRADTAIGTVVASTALSFEVRVTPGVAPAAIGGAVVNNEGALVGIVDLVDGDTVIGRPLASPEPRDEVDPPRNCQAPNDAAATESMRAFTADHRAEIKALLVFQLEEEHLANGDYDLAQAMDPTLAQLSWDQMVNGWSVTSDSFVVPVDWTNAGGDVEWRLGLVTHESDGTSKLFCVTRSYDDPAQKVTRLKRGSSLVFERRSGWVEPNEVLDEIRAAC